MLRGPQGDKVDVPPVPDIDLPLQGQAGGELPQLQPQGLPQSQQPQHLHLGGRSLKRVLTSETRLRKRIFYFIKTTNARSIICIAFGTWVGGFPVSCISGSPFHFLDEDFEFLNKDNISNIQKYHNGWWTMCLNW